MENNKEKNPFLTFLNTTSSILIILGIVSLIIRIIVETIFNISFVQSITSILLVLGVIFNGIYNGFEKNKKGMVVDLIALIIIILF